MSDLLGTSGGGNGRPSNGRSRAATGPVSAGTPGRTMPGVATPHEVLSSARARRNKAEEAAAQRAQEEERRRSAERRAQAAGVAGTTQPQPSRNTATSRPTYDSGYVTAGSEARTQGGQPGTARTQDTAAAVPTSRTRTTSQSQTQPRPAPPTAAASQPPTGPPPNQPRPAQPHTRQASGAQQPQTAATGQMPASSGGAESARPRQTNVSSFPHAFERWETLSSHWEGLTSYWIRRLEQNTEEVRREPLAQQMSRQITDLSAAGANLFHAVVELQRLRASSERKFQRWFFETRQEQERMQEAHAEMERTLASERAAREEAEQRADRADRAQHGNNKKNSEIQRELQIAKEEARRAWEELGRREQEERDRTASLREGRATLVGGVQVVPMPAGMSRTGSISAQRPSTQEREQQGVQPQYSYESQSPTDTDPYASAAVRGASSALRNDPGTTSGSIDPNLYSYPSGSTPQTSSSTHTAIPASQPTTTATSTRTQPAPITTSGPTFTIPTSTSESSSPERFYTHAGTYLDAQSGATYRPTYPTTSGPSAPAAGYATSGAEDTVSYIPSGESDISAEDDEDYELDARGNPVRYRGRQSLDSGDSYDVHSDIAREREHASRYTQPASTIPPGSSTLPTSSAGIPGQAYTSTSGSHAQGQQPDYSGEGYGDGEGGYDQWAGIQRHHHPTRLSDVLEEDERSQISQGTRSVRSRPGGGAGTGYPSER